MKLKLFRLFRGGIGFSFWSYYGNGGTGILFHKLVPGLFGIRLVRWQDSSHEIRAIAIGFWWSIELTICAIPLKQFEKTMQ